MITSIFQLDHFFDEVPERPETSYQPQIINPDCQAPALPSSSSTAPGVSKADFDNYIKAMTRFSGYFQIPIDHLIKRRLPSPALTGHLPIGRMAFWLCNAPGTSKVQVAIFHDMIEKTMEIFKDDFSVFGDSFSSCFSYLDKMLQRCEESNLVLIGKNATLMVKEE
ncbi:hypothetical protein Tco_0930284 [Tanacetum coccineum]